MKVIIETSKGKFAVCEILNNAVFGLKFNYYVEDKYEAMFDNSENNFSYEKCYKLSEITELEASGIVDINRIVDGKTAYKDYLSFRFLYKAIESLHSLLESQGIEITNNTYIFKV